MIHEIKNQNGKHIIDTFYRDEIIEMINNDKDNVLIHDVKISLISDFKTDEVRETIVRVEGI